MEEEAIAVMLQKEKAKSLSAEDFGLEDVRGEDSHQEDEEQTLQVIELHDLLYRFSAFKKI